MFIQSDEAPSPLQDKRKELLLCVPAGWETYVSKEFYELHQGLMALGWSRMVIGEFADEMIVRAIRQSEIVILWEGYELLERNNDELMLCTEMETGRGKRIFFCDDVHYFDAHRRQQRKRAFDWADLILATYPDQLRQWYPEVAEQKIKWTPHSAASYFHPNFPPSSDRVLLSGSRTWPYPFRQFCHAKLPDAICDVIDHPGYPGYPGDKANAGRADSAAMQRLGGEHYAELLRQYPAMLICGSIFGYLVAKVFEGMATGCLVIGERQSLGGPLAKLGFAEGEHYIGTDLLHVIEDTKAIRDALLRKDPRCSCMTARARQKVSEEHTTAVRAAQIHTICMELITK